MASYPHGQRFPRPAAESVADSVFSDASRNTEKFPAFRPAFRPAADSIARADNPGDALMKYRESPAGANYEQMGVGMPKSMEEIQQAKQAEKDARRKGANTGDSTTQKKIGAIVVAAVVLVVVVAVVVSGGGGNGADNGGANGAGNDGGNGANDGGDNAEVTLTVPLDRAQLVSLCDDLRERLGGSVDEDQRWFGCLPGNVAFTCEGEDNDEDSCVGGEVCLCPSNNLFERDSNPCESPESINEAEDCVAFDLSLLV